MATPCLPFAKSQYLTAIAAVTGAKIMSMEHWSKGQATSTETGIADAQDIAAALLLRRIEAMLREGQPRQAIAHICDMTGVDRAQAEAFVADLKTRLFAGQG
ncbi:MAG: hypothetical protein ACRCY3_12645 [Sphingorhabdus sp.]